LLRLAIIDESAAEQHAGLRLGQAGAHLPDARTAELVRVAATGAPAACLEWSGARALAAGATEDEITGVLLAIAPVAGLGRVVSAVPGLATGLGYDIETALMEADDP
jgi:4-carboxymuconolactone decarboxylase